MPTISRTRGRIPATVHPLLLLMAAPLLGVGELSLEVRRAGADENKDQGPVVQQTRQRSEDDARDRMAEAARRRMPVGILPGEDAEDQRDRSQNQAQAANEGE